MKFYTTNIEITDRHTEPRNWQNIDNCIKHEEITVSVKLTSSGNTTTFENDEIKAIISEKLKTIDQGESDNQKRELLNDFVAAYNKDAVGEEVITAWAVDDFLKGVL